MCEVQNQILETFWWFDDEGKGVITRGELARVLRSLSPDWNDTEVDRLVQLADPKSHGVVKYREFVAWIMGASDDYDEAQKGCCEPLEPERKGPSALEAKQLEAEALACRIARDLQMAERAGAEANELLEAALPALEAAAEALDGLGDEELAELGTAREPPPSVAAIAASLCALRPLGPGTGEAGEAGGWADSSGLLSAPGLRARLREYNKDGVGPEQVAAVRRLLGGEGAGLLSGEAPQAEGLSAAARALLLWVRGVVRYFEAATAAAPKFELVNTLHQGMCRAEAALKKVNEEVEALAA